jgi:hypothetical protein
MPYRAELRRAFLFHKDASGEEIRQWPWKQRVRNAINLPSYVYCASNLSHGEARHSISLGFFTITQH